MKMSHIAFGSAALGIGVFGIYDEYFTVVELFKGVLQPLLAFAGLVAILSGLLTLKPKVKRVAIGLVLLGLGIFGFFDEYYSVLDFFKGAVPPALLLVGSVAVVSGVRSLNVKSKVGVGGGLTNRRDD